MFILLHQKTFETFQVDDEKVVSGSYDKTLKVWDIKTGQCRLTLRYSTACETLTYCVAGVIDSLGVRWVFYGGGVEG